VHCSPETLSVVSKSGVYTRLPPRALLCPNWNCDSDEAILFRLNLELDRNPIHLRLLDFGYAHFAAKANVKSVRHANKGRTITANYTLGAKLEWVFNRCSTNSTTSLLTYSGGSITKTGRSGSEIPSQIDSRALRR
jgi:hypothetical protein